MELDDKARLFLADPASAGHALRFEAGKQGIQRHPIGTAAVAVDAVHDLGDLADGIKERYQLRRFGEILFLEDVVAVDTGPGYGMLRRSVGNPRQKKGSHCRSQRTQEPAPCDVSVHVE